MAGRSQQSGETELSGAGYMLVATSASLLRWQELVVTTQPITSCGCAVRWRTPAEDREKPEPETETEEETEAM